MAQVTGFITVYESSDGGTGSGEKTSWQFFVGTHPVSTKNPYLAETVRLAIKTDKMITATVDESGFLSQVRIALQPSNSVVQKPFASAADCTTGFVQGQDNYLGYAGMWISSTPGSHTLTVVTDAGHACINFAMEDSEFTAWLAPPYYPSRSFNSSRNRVFIFAGLKGACGNPPFGTAPIRGCKTAYGWFLEIDSTNTGNYDTTVAFYN